MLNAKKAMDKLFVSRVRVKLLNYFLMNPDVPVHLRGAVRELKEEINAVRRELNRMEEVKLLTSESRGNRKYYMLNRQGPFVEELTGIVYKTFGLGGDIIRNESRLGDVKFAVLTSDYITRVTSSSHNVDLVLIGEINMDELEEIISTTEAKEKREVNYTVLKTTEFELRKRRKDSFVMELLLTPKLMLLGSSVDLAS
jgi:uncharacterized protein